MCIYLFENKIKILKDEERKIHTLKYRTIDKCTVPAVQGNSRGIHPAVRGAVKGTHPVVQTESQRHTPYSTGQ